MRRRSARSYLSQLEKGAFYASLKIIGKVAQALDVQPAELLSRQRSQVNRAFPSRDLELQPSKCLASLTLPRFGIPRLTRDAELLVIIASA